MAHDGRTTVVVASYNHVRFLEEALASVFDQVGDEVEVIVVDDASKDDSQNRITQLLQENGWSARTILHVQNRGVCATFNEALALVKTEFVTFLAADDRMLSGRIAKQVAALQEAGPEYGLCHADLAYIDEHGAGSQVSFSDHAMKDDRPTLRPSGPQLVERLLRGNWIGAPSAVIRTAAVREVGGYDENLWSEDIDLWVRLAHEFGFVYVDEQLVEYRRVESSMTGTKAFIPYMHRDFLKFAPKHLGTSPTCDEFIRQRCFLLARELYRLGELPAAQALWSMNLLRRHSKSPGVLVDCLLVAVRAPRGLIRRWERVAAEQ